MGYYTEIIFGARLKMTTPKNIIDTLRYVANYGLETIASPTNLESEDPVVAVENKLIEEYDLWSVMRGSSYYFGVCEAVTKMFYDNTTKEWILSVRANCRSAGRLERFTEWLRPYVKYGMGDSDIFSIITTEDGYPIMYGLRGTFSTIAIPRDEQE